MVRTNKKERKEIKIHSFFLLQYGILTHSYMFSKNWITDAVCYAWKRRNKCKHHIVG